MAKSEQKRHLHERLLNNQMEVKPGVPEERAFPGYGTEWDTSLRVLLSPVYIKIPTQLTFNLS